MAPLPSLPPPHPFPESRTGSSHSPSPPPSSPPLPPFLFLNTHLDPYCEVARGVQASTLAENAADILRTSNASAILAADFNTLRGGDVFTHFTIPLSEKLASWRDSFSSALWKDDLAVTTFHGFSGLRLSSFLLRVPLSLASSLLSLLPYPTPFRWRPDDFHIDWLLFSNTFASSHAASLSPIYCHVISDDVDGVFPSDHYPVVCEYAAGEENSNMLH